MALFGSKKKKDPKQEYKEFIEYSVKSGMFFQDAYDWYIFRYVAPLCDRTWLFFTTIASFIISYILFVMIVDSFPIVEKVPIIIKAKDTVVYYPKISPLKDSKDLKTIEESVIKYLLVRYLKQREEYNFAKLTTNDLNQKFEVIQNSSTVGEFKKFKSFMGLNNKNSPIKDFGKNVSRKVAIKSFSFKREINQDFMSKAKNFVYTELPSQAVIEYVLTYSAGEKSISRNYKVRMSFKFSRINNKNLDEEIAFKVSEYVFLATKQSK